MGASEFHSFFTLAMKVPYFKKNLNNARVWIDLENSWRSLTRSTYISFEEVVWRTSDWHAPLNNLLLKANFCFDLIYRTDLKNETDCKCSNCKKRDYVPVLLVKQIISIENC